MNKFEEYLSMAKISDFIHRKELEEEKKKTVCLVFAIIAGIAAIAAEGTSRSPGFARSIGPTGEPDAASDAFPASRASGESSRRR